MSKPKPFKIIAAIGAITLFFSTSLLGQKVNPDSLWQVYHAHPNDTTGLIALEQIANRHLIYLDPDSTRRVLQRMRRTARKIHWVCGEWLYFKDMGAVENRNFNLRKSLAYSDSAVQYGNRYGIFSAAVLGNIGGTYMRMQLYDSALLVLNEGLFQARQVQNHRLECQLCLSLAAVYGNKGDAKSALKYSLSATNLAETHGIQDMLGKAYLASLPAFSSVSDTTLVRTYAQKLMDLGKSEANYQYQFLALNYQANYWQERSWEISDDATVYQYNRVASQLLDQAEGLLKYVKGGFEVRNYWMLRAKNYSVLGQPDAVSRAYATAKRAQPYEMKSQFGVGELTDLGVAFVNEGAHRDSAIRYLQDAARTAVAIRYHFGAARAFRLLANIYADPKANDFPKAYEAYIQYKIYEDSVLNADKVREMTAATLNSNFELERAAKDKNILQLQNQNLAAELRIRAQTDALFRNKTEAEKARILLDLLHKDNALQSVTIRLQNDSINTQQLRLQLEQLDKTAQLEQLRRQQEADTARRNNIIFFLAGLLVLAGAAFGVFRFRQKARHERRVAEVEMRALRAQINPHFLANAMNTVNGFIARQDTDSAMDYLGRFSRVMRNILENSRQPVVHLEKELELLEQYLEMEQKRLEPGFDFRIQVSDESLYDAAVPGLILQPFVENAVIHGLRPKVEGARFLSVTVSKSERGGLLCVIEDNGVGRKPGNSDSKAPSMGLAITLERLQLWHKGKMTTPFVFTDLKDAVGRPAGTRVEVVL